jgi:hypothetical protein
MEGFLVITNVIYPSQFKVPYQLPLPQHPQADTKQAARVKRFALKMDQNH